MISQHSVVCIGADGSVIDLGTVPAGQVVITESMVDKLDASIGDTVTITWQNQQFTFTVADIAKDQVIAGSLDIGTPAW